MKMLHAGCGGAPLPEMFSAYKEYRLDIVPNDGLDYVASIVDMVGVPDNEFDALFTSHTLEHVYQYEVVPALKSFLRVLKPSGFAIIVVPKLDGLSPTENVLYVSEAGPITARDMFYGKIDLIKDYPYMAHKTGFVTETFTNALKEAGFAQVHVNGENFDLIAIAVKDKQ
jgi:predicted SAM-dependent methyltransferase